MKSRNLLGEFPILRRPINGNRLVYLDNAATTQKPLAVLEAMERYWEETNANIHRGVHTLSQEATAAYEHARKAAQILLNAKEDREVIFTKGTTDSINLVAASLTRAVHQNRPIAGMTPLAKGTTILLSAMEHHSNIVPWQMAAAETGARIEVIPIDDNGVIDLDAYSKRLKTGGVSMVAVTHVGNALGVINPTKEMIALAHEAGALFLVDGAQAAGHLPIDVQDLDVDFYTASGHKMYGPTGIGLLYGKRELLEAMPPYQGGGDMIRTVSFEGSTYAELPAKFEAGTPNIAGVVGLGAAIEWIADLTGSSDRQIGSASEFPGASGEKGKSGDYKVRPIWRPVLPVRIQLLSSLIELGEQEQTLAATAADRLAQIEGVRILANPSIGAGIVSFVMDQAHPHDIGTILDSEGVAIRAGHHCCMPLMKRLGVPATARASFAAYNTVEDVDTLVSAVRKVAEVFA